MKKSLLVLIFCLLFFPINSLAARQALPVGSEFQVNSYSDSDQTTADIAMASDGSFVITWANIGQDGSGYGVYAQRYNSDGSTAGSEFQVNSYTDSDQMEADIAMASDGSFVITWASAGQDGSGNGVYAQRYNSDGSTAGSEFQVNSYTDSNQMEADIAMSSGGSFVITWESGGQDGSSNGVYAQRYNSDGSTAGSEFLVNSTTSTNERLPSAAMDDYGSFIIAWTYDYGSTYEIYAQRYDVNGSAEGVEFQVNDFSVGQQEVFPTVSMAQDGSFVVTWDRYSFNQPSGWDVFARSYDATGNPVGTEFMVNKSEDGNHRESDVSMKADGSYVVTWYEDWNIYKLEYSSSNRKIGKHKIVNSGRVWNSKIAAAQNIGYVVVWERAADDGSGYDIFAQRYEY